MRYSRTHKSSISANQNFEKIESFQNLLPAEIKSHIQKAFNKTVYQPYTKLSVDELAIKSGVSRQLIYNTANKNLPFKCSLLNIISVMRASQNPAILEAMSNVMGYYIFKVDFSKAPKPEKMLQNIFKLEILYEQLLVSFEKFYASGADDREVLREITENLFGFIGVAGRLRATSFMKLRGKNKD